MPETVNEGVKTETVTENKGERVEPETWLK